MAANTITSKCRSYLFKIENDIELADGSEILVEKFDVAMNDF